jgi:Ca-activated chloride channel family protein
MEDRTQQMGAGAWPPAGATIQTSRTAMGMPTNLGQMDPMRTAMGAPMRALEVEALMGSAAAFAGETTTERLLLLFRSSGAAVGRRMPLNLGLAIDRSGSMEGEALEYVKRACAYVVDLLEPSDVLSIVTFEEQVDVLMPARRVLNKALIKEHIQRIQPGNTTNLYDGMTAACMQVGSLRQPGYLNRVLVLTDGEPTAGIKDYNTIVSSVAQQKAAGISITALGFGGEYNEELMAGIARRSGGNYYYITQPTMIPEVFRRELETLMTITAKNIRVRLQLPRGVQGRYVYGVQGAQLGARTVEFTLPDIERGSTVANLTEFQFERHTPGIYRTVKAEITYDDAVTGRTETITADGIVEFTNDRAQVEASRNPIVQREYEVHLASRNLEKTMMGMRTQQLTSMGALQQLERTRTILMQSGRSQQAQEVTMAMQALQSGGSGDAEKTLIGTIYNLDQGKSK